MKIGMGRVLGVSEGYRRPIFDALGLQVVLGVLSKLVLDGGDTAHVCGIALVAFWVGAAVLIGRRPDSPSQTDLKLIRFGYLPLVAFAFLLVRCCWHWRGLEH